MLTDLIESRHKSIILLSGLTLIISVYLLTTFVLISEDGVMFIQYAQQLSSQPRKAVMDNYQHPGYPVTIYLFHNIVSSDSPQSWIYIAQITTVVFRMLSIIVLYLIAEKITNRRYAFWCVLIYLFLPILAQFGSDALSDYPFLFFLLAGLLVFVTVADGTVKYALVGFLAGIGYLLRPEAVQLLICASLWLVYQCFHRLTFGSQARVVLAGVIMFCAFAVPAGPYIILKGKFFPKKSLIPTAQNDAKPDINTEYDDALCCPVHPSLKGQISEYEPKFLKEKHAHRCDYQAFSVASLSPVNLLKSFVQFTENIFRTYIYIWVCPFVIGLLGWLKHFNIKNRKYFFVTSFLVLNVVMLIWLHVQYGYISKRHTLPFATVGSIFIPGGTVVCAAWISSRFKFSRKIRPMSLSSAKFSFAVFLIAAVVICLITLGDPPRSEKKYYLTASNWLKEHTSKTDIIMVADRRIAFYADRNFRVYTDLNNIDAEADYLVVLTHKYSNIPKNGTVVFDCSGRESHGIRVFKLTKSK